MLKPCKAKAVFYSAIDYEDDDIDESYILTCRFWHEYHALIHSCYIQI